MCRRRKLSESKLSTLLEKNTKPNDRFLNTFKFVAFNNCIIDNATKINEVQQLQPLLR